MILLPIHRSDQSKVRMGYDPAGGAPALAAKKGSPNKLTADVKATIMAAFDEVGKPFKWVSYVTGDATQIADADASFDVVACTQIAEYVPDVNRVISEALRVLKPGGRAVFVATDWDALVWHSERPDRMALVMKSWESHCAHLHLPRSLSSRLVSAGFRFDGATVFPILNLKWDDDAYSKGLADLIRDFVGRKRELPPEDLKPWYDEFARLSEAARYFFIFERQSPAPEATP